MAQLPVMLELADLPVLIVGGGEVAVRRARSLVDAGARVCVVADRVSKALEALNVQIERRCWQAEDLIDQRLVVTATDDPQINGAVARAAAERGVWVNRADSAGSGDLEWMASRQQGPLTLAVATGGISAAAAGQIADELATSLGAHWPQLLEAVAPFRRRVQASALTPHRRQALLRQSVDAEARTALRLDGRAGLERYLERLWADACAS